MKKILIILLIVVVAVIGILLNKLSGNGSIKASLTDSDETTGKTQTSKLEIVYKREKPSEMILEVSSDSKEIFDTTYGVVETIVESIKEKNADDPISLEKKEKYFKLKASVESEGFTYPKDYPVDKMKGYLKEQGWNVR